ncbi:MAG TPA: hypothetical protein K8U80_01245 [Collinsella ihuae]|uniref:D-ribose pyranase n=1 Tax=Collinsella ihumii TaxID=1720204 RepID=A0A921IQ90_9ACTN|nr:hypothetical protein [Collinsella ihumii]
MRQRILNERLAAIVASIRHGEMIFVADAGSGTCAQALWPLSPEVEYLDLEAVSGSPSFQDIAGTLVEVGDFEAAIVSDLMRDQNPKDFSFITGLLGEKNVTEVTYIPDFYQLRDRCRAVVQTGDCGAHAQAILVAGYCTDPIPMDWLCHGLKGLNS